jgi:hypothetical protein
MSDDCECRYRFDSVCKDASESLKVELDFYALAVLAWERNKYYLATDIRRPTVPNGYAYQTMTGGLSGSKEPRWPVTLGELVKDGAVTWTCIAATTSNGINPISAPSAVSDPVGLTIGSISVLDNRSVLATYTSGTLDQDYDAVYTVTIDGVPRVARQTVQIRKR